ncbi:hypothetical protein DB346_23970 [Verrucomicrobia bacterium LW23]|nr:hypothetical protein DB346_23970 [Verrucomicrobia bacterium LW23]
MANKPEFRSRAPGIAITLACALLLYVLSMVPIGRLYLGGYLAPDTWHERTLVTFYAPVLYVVARWEPLYNLTVAYSRFLEPLIPPAEDPREIRRIVTTMGGYVKTHTWWAYERTALFRERLMLAIESKSLDAVAEAREEFINHAPSNRAE